MSLVTFFVGPALPVLLALAAALLLLGAERRRWAGSASLAPVLALLCSAAVLLRLGSWGWAVAPLLAGLVAAALAQDGRDPLPGECALKLQWVLGGAFALTVVGFALVTLATGVTSAPEQWSVLRLGLSQRMVWSVALPLVLLVGVVLLGGAPFHFWVADLFQGAPSALVPLAVAALQASGAMWIAARLEGIEAFAPGASLAGAALRTAAAAAFLAGAATILAQRQPERRVGTLASLQGGLALATLATALGRGESMREAVAWLVPWAGHLALALSGASLLARLTPARPTPSAPGGPLFRRHPLTALVGLYSLFSLAGVPGTPGAGLWLEVGQGLAASGRSGLLIAVALGWLAEFATAMRDMRQGFGTATALRPQRAVPRLVRTALWVTGAGVATMGAARLVLG